MIVLAVLSPITTVRLPLLLLRLSLVLSLVLSLLLSCLFLLEKLLGKEPKPYASFDEAVRTRLKSVTMWGGTTKSIDCGSVANSFIDGPRFVQGSES